MNSKHKRKIIFSSAAKETMDIFVREKGIPFLQKPYSLHDLFKTIKEIIK